MKSSKTANYFHPLNQHGFQILAPIYTDQEIETIIQLLNKNGIENKFGVREVLFNHPDIAEAVFNDKLIQVVKQISPEGAFSIKSIYFDKPPTANWIVNWHQDLTINLKGKKEHEGFINWRVKPERTVVQPSIDILENIFTIRIHLDDCTQENGALRVIEKSHKKGVIQITDWIKGKVGVVRICEVEKGGILIMKPLILHASKRTQNKENRRVIHIEFSNMELPQGLEWKERVELG